MYIPGWHVTLMHPDCKQCEECANNALSHAKETDGTRAQSSFQQPLEGMPNATLHAATVIKR